MKLRGRFGLCRRPLLLLECKMVQEAKKISELDAMMRLAEVLNDTPTQIEISGEKYNITALKLGTQILIAEETCKIQKHKEGNLVDIFNQFTKSLPAVVRCLAYAILNDKNKIYKDYGTKTLSDEFFALCERIEWESNKNQWMAVLAEVIQKIDINFSLTITEQMSMIRDMMMKKMTPER